jgi:hypothetical protein
MGMFSELKKIDEKAQDKRQRKKPARVVPAPKAAATSTTKPITDPATKI